eukprot:Hpha_TRINITY_DN24679_c0_g1::TRINITY_DN24679_c0_g1_i1::g.147422::m.147422
MMKAVFMGLLCGAVSAAAAPPFTGPFAVQRDTYNISTLDSTYPSAIVVSPVPTEAGQTFPLVVYMHGLGGGGFYEDWGEAYKVLFTNLASHGYVIVAPQSCNLGCSKHGFTNFYKEAGKCIDWARTMGGDKLVGRINWDIAIGAAGHSMGGQAVVRIADKAYAEQYGVKAVVAHHPADDNGGVNISVPFAVYSGNNDACCGTKTSHHIWDPAPKPKFMAIKADAPHTEPVLFKDNGLGLYTAAWFKVYLEGDKGSYHDLIFGNTADSMCNYYNMTFCEANV